MALMTKLAGSENCGGQVTLLLNSRGRPMWIEPAEQTIDNILALEKDLWRIDRGRVAALDLLRQGILRYPGQPRLLAQHVARARSLADWRDGAPSIAALIATGESTWPFYVCDEPAVHRAAAMAYRTAREIEAVPSFKHGPATAKMPLRIGYLSTDFRSHPTSLLTAELFERHDRRRVTVTGYSLRASDESALRRRIEAGFDRFVDLSGATDAEAAARIYGDSIDILVDLNGYRRGARSGILARRPAPVQVSFLAFPGTMAADFIDYMIGDPIVFGNGAAEHFTERLVVLPDTYQPNDSRQAIASPPPTRSEVGLPASGFVYCCFNSPRKIAPAMFDCWMRLLKQIDGAVLWLLAPWAGVADNLRREAAARGVEPARLVIASRLPLADHLARLGLADLALDTLPYGAHTTGSNALWAGVPMLTCLGKSFAGRVGASLLNAIGLPELITLDLDAYERLALRLAHEPDLLASFRRRLAANRLTTPLFDCARYTRHLEIAYGTMWAIHCESGEPRSFGVLPQ